ncbi:MAG: hypothetical protein MUF84_09155 [Anaerolineae bacterium]|nr:hypothetical protein [Anaerolineae bacterium]
MAYPINIHNEKSLHAALKAWYAGDDGDVEARVGGYIVDVVRDDLLIEVQTRSFASVRAKVAALASDHRVLLAYPVALETWLVRPAESGGRPSRRKSPKRGSALAIFPELVSFPGLVASPNFEIDVVFTREDVLRHYDARRGWRDHGWVTDDRILLEVVETQRFAGPADFATLLPDGLGEPFSTAELARAVKRTQRFAQKMAYCLREMGLLADVGRRGHAILYRRAGGDG